MSCEVQAGIDTMCFYQNLTSKQKDRLLGELRQRPAFRTVTADYFSETYEYASDCFAADGIKLRIFRKGKSVWGLFVILHPTLLLGEADRSALYHPEKKSYKKLIKRTDTLLKDIPIPYPVDEMVLTRLDLTFNLIFEKASTVDWYIHVLKKSLLLPKYHLEWFREGDGRAKDVKEANKHSYKQSCKSASFFAYDKTAQLEMIGRFPDTLTGKRVLRLECQLRRKALKKWVDKDNMDNILDMLKTISKKQTEIVKWYLKRMHIISGTHMRYADAEWLVKTVSGDKMRKRMLYLLRKTSDCRDLMSAIGKTKEKYNLSQGQLDRMLKKFSELGISPITLPNACGIDELPPLGKLV